MAMKFVYENIENFNGDRTNITLVGHEAGAASEGIHILSERFLFKKTDKIISLNLKFNSRLIFFFGQLANVFQ